ncbi:hypothetical protein ABTZ78_23655 [Streptomyces bauhiniae]|uniref:hypothetical protein n=1 Tax=Streptomyces bauhiniae TaxID=2340725 RepID=UPI003324A4BB
MGGQVAGSVAAGAAVWGSDGQASAVGQTAVPESGGQVAVGDEASADGSTGGHEAVDGSACADDSAGGGHEPLGGSARPEDSAEGQAAADGIPSEAAPAGGQEE